MRRSNPSPQEQATQKLLDVVSRAQVIGSRVAQEVDARFGDEIAGFKRHGQEVLRRVHAHTQAIHQRLSSDGSPVPGVIRRAVGQVDGLVGRMAVAHGDADEGDGEPGSTPTSRAATETAAGDRPGPRRAPGHRPRRRRKPQEHRPPRTDGGGSSSAP